MKTSLRWGTTPRARRSTVRSDEEKDHESNPKRATEADAERGRTPECAVEVGSEKKARRRTT